jgi:hypothetical protein
VVDDALPLRRIALSAAGIVATLVLASVVVMALLHAWRLPPGGQSGSAALASAMPAPRLQTAPQAGPRAPVEAVPVAWPASGAAR